MTFEDRQHRWEIMTELFAERDRQIAKWGKQVVPSLEHNLLDSSPAEDICRYYGLLSETAAKAACDRAHRLGRLTSAHIAVEELAEAISCGSNEVAMREELVQVAAVIVHWIECIDGRRAPSPDHDPNED